jgi:hypothetical protein
MFKRIARDFLILFGIAALYCSTSRTFMQYVWAKRDGLKWWNTYPMKHGDLVSMSYLDFVPRFNPPPDRSPFKHTKYRGPKNTVVYLHGDSYTWQVRDSNLATVCAYHYISRYAGGYYKIEPAKRNILIIEIAERMFRGYFNTTKMVDEVKDSASQTGKVTVRYTAVPEVHYASLITGLALDSLFNKNINQNLQCNLFNYNFIIPMFEYKAALNYYLFNRASGDVVISNDRTFLFLNETVNREMTSSYGPLSGDDVKRMVGNLNAIYEHFKSKGFTEVYLTIIPNSATIMQPEGYNNLIPLVYHHPDLKMKYIDVYTAYRQAPTGLYLPGDTHWTKKGFEKWVAVVNDTLVSSLQLPAFHPNRK